MPLGASALSDDCWAHVCAFTGGSGIALAELTSTSARRWTDNDSTVWGSALLREFDYAVDSSSFNANRDDTTPMATSDSADWSEIKSLSRNRRLPKKSTSADLRQLYGHLATARVCTFGVRNYRYNGED